jgi:hypothetical protein
MMSPSVRQEFLEGGGFCTRHFRMAKQIEEQTWPAGGIGMAILCEDLLRVADFNLQSSRSLSRNPKFPLRNRRGDHPFLPGQSCIFCNDTLDKERFLLEVLEELVDEREFAEPLSKHGLCVRHTQLTREIWIDETKRAKLFAELRKRLGDLSADLREFIRKHDYQFRHEPPGPEANAVERTMGLLLGSRDETSISRPER